MIRKKNSLNICSGNLHAKELFYREGMGIALRNLYVCELYCVNSDRGPRERWKWMFAGIMGGKFLYWLHQAFLTKFCSMKLGRQPTNQAGGFWRYLKYADNKTWSWSCGRRDNSVGIATGYELDGQRIESRWGRDFPHLSRPALGPTVPPVQWIPEISRR